MQEKRTEVTGGEIDCNYRRNDGRTWTAVHCPEINDDSNGRG